MAKQSLRDCILEGLEALDKIPMTEERDDLDIDNHFTASFLAGWISAAIKYDTVEIEIKK